MSAESSPDGVLAVVEFEATYSLVTLQKAAIKLSDLCSFDFESKADGGTRIRLNALNSHSVVDVQQLSSRFKNEVLDQQLRAIVAAETESERNLILAYTFSNTKLVRQ